MPEGFLLLPPPIRAMLNPYAVSSSLTPLCHSTGDPLLCNHSRRSLRWWHYFYNLQWLIFCKYEIIMLALFSPLSTVLKHPTTYLPSTNHLYLFLFLYVCVCYCACIYVWFIDRKKALSKPCNGMEGSINFLRDINFVS